MRSTIAICWLCSKRYSSGIACGRKRSIIMRLSSCSEKIAYLVIYLCTCTEYVGCNYHKKSHEDRKYYAFFLWWIIFVWHTSIVYIILIQAEQGQVQEIQLFQSISFFDDMQQYLLYKKGVFCETPFHKCINLTISISYSIIRWLQDFTSYSFLAFLVCVFRGVSSSQRDSYEYWLYSW